MKKGIHILMFLLILVNIVLYKLDHISRLDFDQMIFMFPCVWIILSTGDFEHEKK